MKYNFDKHIERSNTASVKYDLRKMFFGKEDIIPMWVADMDFATPDFILNAIKNRLDHPVLGYSIRPTQYYDSIVSWMKRHHDWVIENDWICFSPGIVPALNFIVLAYTNPGDKIIVQPPVYFPFFGAVKQHQRVLNYNPLKLINGRYYFNYTDLEKHCKDGARMIILSNPHNPGGSAWHFEELRKLTDICLKYNVLIVSDEIHADLVNIGHSHTVVASLSKNVSERTITLTAPSKTFNLAALSTASVIIPNKKLRKVYNTFVQNLHIDMGNLFGTVASIAAYEKGDEWLAQLLEYINSNINELEQYLAEKIPSIKMIRPEATYMAWLDCSALGLNDKDLNKFFINQAGVGLNPGIQFGKGGAGFMRINVACPRKTMLNALDQIRIKVEQLLLNTQGK